MPSGPSSRLPLLVVAMALVASGCGRGPRCPDGARFVERPALTGAHDGTEAFCVGGQQRRPKVGLYERRAPDGVLIERGRYGANGRRTGLWQRFHRDGSKRWEAGYRDGRQHGPWRAWHPNGAASSAGRFEDGKKHGRWQRWREDGSREVEGTYAHGLRDGPWREYHPNGRLAGQGRYAAGQRITWTAYRVDGRPRQRASAPTTASADACWAVVRRACGVLQPTECGALSQLLSRATLSRQEREQCGAMLRDDNLFADMLSDLMFQWRVHNQP